MVQYACPQILQIKKNIIFKGYMANSIAKLVVWSWYESSSFMIYCQQSSLGPGTRGNLFVLEVTVFVNAMLMYQYILQIGKNLHWIC